jgi:hypothetical protein
VASRVEQDAHMRLRLVGRHLRTESHGLGRRRLEVVDRKVDVGLTEEPGPYLPTVWVASREVPPLASWRAA